MNPQLEFIERTLPEIAPRQSLPTPVVHTEKPKTPVAAQATLPLFDAPADKPKEAFVWDDSLDLNHTSACGADGTPSVVVLR